MIQNFEEFTHRFDNNITTEQKVELRDKAIDVWTRFCTQNKGKYFNPQRSEEKENTVNLNKFKFYFNYKNTDKGMEVDVCAECIDYWVDGKLYCICLVGEEAEHGAEEDNLKELTSMLFLQQSTE